MSGILFHSVFVGITIAMTTDGLVVLLTAIMFHQMFEGLGLGSRIAAVPYPRGSFRPWLLVFAFGTTAPIGQAIGIASRNSYDPESELGLIMVGVFNAMWVLRSRGPFHAQPLTQTVLPACWYMPPWWTWWSRISFQRKQACSWQRETRLPQLLGFFSEVSCSADTSGSPPF